MTLGIGIRMIGFFSPSTMLRIATFKVNTGREIRKS
jgi:hypothetical protein